MPATPSSSTCRTPTVSPSSGAAIVMARVAVGWGGRVEERGLWWRCSGANARAGLEGRRRGAGRAAAGATALRHLCMTG